ncbi:hypothetical protein [Sphingomonas faeni]|uniref:hypothetical protein n=1 Tax=Sphingomonas faeni TaxID=185950 RepID=UPI0024130A6E|nr:hypothetical protein [Sphingomonas faeni]
METNTTRRNLLRFGTTAAVYAAGASIVTGGIALASQAKSATPPGISPGLHQAIAALAAAERASTRYTETTYEPARARWLAAKEAMPHVIVPPSAEWRMAPDFWSTGSERALALAKGLVAEEPRTSRRGDVVRARKLLAADHRRARAIARAGKTSGLMDACDEAERLGDLVVAAEDAVCAYPASGLADLEAKLAFFTERDLAQNEGNMALVLADARRLLAQEGR